jgi:hypothetical protein
MSTEGIKIDLEKIHTIQDWGPPSNLNDIYIFLGFINIYYLFVHNY